MVDDMVTSRETRSDRWDLRDPTKMPPKKEFPEDVRDKPLAERKRWWMSYLRFTDSPSDHPRLEDLTPEQLYRRDRYMAAWRAWHRTGDDTYLRDAGLLPARPAERST